MKDLIDILDFSVEELDELMHTALDMIDHPEKYAEACKGKRLATLFYEPSTRTRLSFESAMLGMGGTVIGFSGISGSSVAKGESVHDTAIVVAQLADIIAMRANKEGAPLQAALSCEIPVINAGDGGHYHPTQTLADLLTIYREKGTFNNLTIGLCGDLKYGRTVHSLIHAMARYIGCKFVLISPEELKIPAWLTSVLKEKRIPYTETASLEEALPCLDVLYMTRIQKERFDSQEVYERLKDSYVLTKEKMRNAKNDCIVLHPLPRVNEISVDVDDDPRACYFKQVYNGRFMRQALILKLLNGDRKKIEIGEADIVDGMPTVLKDVLFCRNPRCITSTEQEIPHFFKLKDSKTKTYRCIYCEQEKQL